MSISKIKEEFPVHVSVWNNDFELLDSELSTKKVGNKTEIKKNTQDYF